MGIKELKARIRALNGSKVKAGVMGATYEDGQSVASVASWNEYGVVIPVTPKMRAYLHHQGVHLRNDTKTIRIPPRPFMRQTVSRKRNEWGERSVQVMNAYLRGEVSLEAALSEVGAAMQADIMETIDSNMGPPNAGLTFSKKAGRVVDRGGAPIDGKSGTKQTLIDSGTLLKSISYEVET